jgi:long-chain acyl-CoA synthetase
VALLQYTGGTTGSAQGRHADARLHRRGDEPGQSWTTPYTTPGTEKVVCVLPLFHIYALSGIMLGRCATATSSSSIRGPTST